jgi:transcriptional regulator with XRE-family HTH domain
MSDMEFYQQLGRAVAKRRNELRLTQAQVGEALGLTRASLANLENGRQRIMVHQLFRLVEILQLKSILDLVPAVWISEKPPEDLLFKGADLTANEQARVNRLLTTAFGNNRRRKN